MYAAFAGKSLIPVLEVQGHLAYETGDTGADRATLGFGRSRVGVVYETGVDVYQINTNTSSIATFDSGLGTLEAPTSMQMSNPSLVALN